MIVPLRDNDVAGLGVDVRRIVDEALVEADQTPLVEQQSTPAWSYHRVVRVAIQ